MTQSGRGIWAITDLGKTKIMADMAAVESLYRGISYGKREPGVFELNFAASILRDYPVLFK